MRMFFHKENIKTWIIFVVSFVTAGIMYSKLPEQIPMHFNAAGEIDSYGARWTIFIFAGITLLMLLLAEIMKQVDPESKQYKKFGKQYYQIYFLVALLMYAIEVYVIAVSLNIPIGNNNTYMPILIGVLLVVMGNMMPKFKHNYFVGIRTSWTLANEDVWFKTHRFGGKVWVIAGLLLITSVFFSPDGKAITFIVCLSVMVIAPFIYSYLEYKKLTRK